MLKHLLFLFVLSMVPVVELRGAIPLGAAWGIPFWLNYLVCVLILFARRVLFFLAKQPKIGKYFQKIIDIGQSKIDKLGNYEYLGLYLFVAVPMPGTGAWTGSLIATLLQMRLWKAFLVIALGVMTSGILMGIGSWGILGLLGIGG